MRILRMIGCEDSELEFIVWYLKERGLIKLTEHGGLAITAQGVDYLISKHLHAIERLRLTDERATH